ncbi:CpsD/CapB family tyrosine-protein kinase [Sphingomonas nostoxanthinifaciens]|uniref:CpsD/CapB family tyrosine-protein kinase n=1 Tax=Sphingomonas nostoxanthinifaciens TaxID=2872652 RepID=UPI001CC2035E|nr:CpsD/CapB family tyrosine-protein kinase [Sphingomonas nostoxanthinifaciens]UAK24143.1 CpsD/CapB family tyrosine-protein kinase [Sphingomonas nostoxanthinifaciens]
MNAQIPDDMALHGARALLAPPEQTLPHDVGSSQLEEQYLFGFRNSDTRARPFKLLRSQVLKQCQDSGMKVIGVTAPSPNVGKTLVATNLAAAMSRIADLDVYLVDLDLHRPAVAQRFSMGESLGIHDYLSGEAPDLQSVARRINDERLVVLPGFRRNVATGELLTSSNGDALFEALRALPQSAIVLIDMPPIFADDDAVIISQRLDGYLMVVEDGRTTRKQVRDTVRLLEPTPLIGSVLNRYRNQLFSDEYGYGYSYGYGGYY